MRYVIKDESGRVVWNAGTLEDTARGIMNLAGELYFVKECGAADWRLFTFPKIAEYKPLESELIELVEYRGVSETAVLRNVVALGLLGFYGEQA